MMKITNTLFLILLAQTSFAALPPEYQNQKDLNAMVQYIQNSSKIMSALDRIDFKSKTVYFGDNCWVKFTRKEQHRPRNWVGPVAPLVFSNSNCKIDE